jgi:hypothetical protein
MGSHSSTKITFHKIAESRYSHGDDYAQNTLFLTGARLKKCATIDLDEALLVRRPQGLARCSNGFPYSSKRGESRTGAV